MKSKRNYTKNFIVWSQLVDLGVECAINMIKSTKADVDSIKILQKAIDIQSQQHHKVNIKLFQRLQQYDKPGHYKGSP